jgi:hypothetical protein
MTDISQVLTASIISVITIMMEAENTSETSVNFYQTAEHSIPEQLSPSYMHHENLKFHDENLLQMKK